jgi:hypothetical protein
MSHIIPISSAATQPRSVARERSSPGVRTDAVYVVFTSIDETLAAAHVAADLARAMAVPLALIHFRTVPYSLSVDRPTGLSPLETDSFLNLLRAEALDMRVRVYLCRSLGRAIPMVFKKRSLVVIAGRRRWWFSRTERWRRALETAGHLVVFVDNDQHNKDQHNKDQHTSDQHTSDQHKERFDARCVLPRGRSGRIPRTLGDHESL